MHRENLARRPAGRAAFTLALLAAAGATAQTTAPAPPQSLALQTRPEPPNLHEFVANKQAAIALGKALFWDRQVGSDGKQACASCHFQAGADPRSKNQISPGLNRTLGPDITFKVARPNQQLKPEDFPFHGFEDPDSRSSDVVRTSNDVASSQGVFYERFASITAGQADDLRNVLADPVFNIGGIVLRRVEPRNTPTVINAVFNLRNFWDGRANYVFNGVNPFGKRDSGARVYKAGTGGALSPVQIAIPDASLASQASGPPLSDFEMSAVGRPFPMLGRKLLSVQPLAGQRVAFDDSVLGFYRAANDIGLGVRYADLIRSAFRPEWWSGTGNVNIGGSSHTQMEANFSLYFGLALQLYQATLVSDQTPFDRYAEGQANALSPQQLLGLGVFWGKGKCVNCHGGPAFTNAAIRRQLTPETMARMTMGNGSKAAYDEGYYNIGITKTDEDIGVGGNDPFGRPLSFAGTARGGASYFASIEGLAPNLAVSSSERIAVKGAFKTPGLRNVELTAPYFHNGSVATLMQVVEFYNRGGNFKDDNRDDIDADIGSLDLSHDEKLGLVEFLKALTDERVRRHAAPFDHPELLVPNGHAGDETRVSNDGYGRAVDSWLKVDAVGANGYAAGSGPTSFLALVEAERMGNLARGKPATQSSTSSSYVATRAVDGNTNGKLTEDSVSRTHHQAQPWWQVDLGRPSELSLIEIWNRTDSGREDRVANFTLFVADTDMAGRSFDALKADPTVAKYTYAGTPPSAQIQLKPPRTTGRYVRIQLPGSYEVLNLAEVRVMGRPLP